MYFGGRGRDAVRHLVLEVVGNSFDVVLAGQASRITVTVGRDASITIDDDGPGLQVRDRVGPTVEELFTTGRDTPTADGHRPHVHVAPAGVGLGPVSVLCSAVDLEIRRDGSTYRQSFSRGEAATSLVRTDGAQGTGTTIRIVPDRQVFDDPTFDCDRLADELRELALLTPGLTTTLAVGGHEPETFGPVADLSGLFAHAFTRRRSPSDVPAPLLLSREDDDLSVDLALAWEPDGYRHEVHSYGNFTRTPESGRHVDGLVEGLREVFGHGPVDGLMRGLKAIIHIKLVDPVFPGPTRGRLCSPEAVWAVADTIIEQLPGALDPELAEELRSRVPTRELVASGTYDDDELRRRRKTPI